MGLLVSQGQEIWAIDLTYSRNSTKVSVFRFSAANTSRWVSPDIPKVEEDPKPTRRAQLIGSMEDESGATDSSTTPRLPWRSFFYEFRVSVRGGTKYVRDRLTNRRACLLFGDANLELNPLTHVSRGRRSQHHACSLLIIYKLWVNTLAHGSQSIRREPPFRWVPGN